MIMLRIKNKLFTLISSALFLIALQSVNMVSMLHCYQEKEPESLKKYEN